MTPSDVIFSIITPTRGDRPRALARAVASVAAAALATPALAPGAVEMLVGFDGIRGERPAADIAVRSFNFPKTGNFGHQIRDWLVRQAAGRFLLFLDDDNALTPNVFNAFLPYLEHDFIVARMDAHLAFNDAYIPRDDDFDKCMVQGNIDALCTCISRELLVVRCGGWRSQGNYQADFVNLVRYYRRAKRPVKIKDIVGIYDASRGLDAGGANFRQQALLAKTGRASTPACPTVAD